jgi:hypothetical protein
MEGRRAGLGLEGHAYDVRRRGKRCGEAGGEPVEANAAGRELALLDHIRLGLDDHLVHGPAGVRTDDADTVVLVPEDDCEALAAEERDAGLGERLKGSVERRRLVDGDGGVDQLTLVGVVVWSKGLGRLQGVSTLDGGSWTVALLAMAPETGIPNGVLGPSPKLGIL